MISEEFTDIWPYSWRGMSDSPRVNGLLKAIMDEDINKIKILFSSGKRLEKVDESTFGRILFYKVKNFELIKVLVQNGFNDIWTPSKYCYDEEGYSWGYVGRAYYYEAYDVMNLLMANGFEPFGFHMNYLVKDFIQRNEIKCIDMLIRNGYEIDEIMETAERNHNRKILDYLQSHSFKRNTYALAKNKFNQIPKPVMKKGIIFTKGKRTDDYQRELLDYEDRVNAQKNYFASLSKEDWEKIEYEKELDDLTAKAMIEVAGVR